jgi:pyruvate dehydrogenase E2 component (dihydrolipoamide acetyltransferase)
MAELLMPRLGDTMETGIVARWLRADGDVIALGDPLVEIDTDKATVVVTAEDAGHLRILAPEQAEVPVGETIALLLESPYVQPHEPAPAADRPANDVPTRDDHSANSVREPFIDDRHVAPRGDRARLRVSPVARRLAKRTGVELTGIRGTGPDGRILKTDVLRAVSVGAGATNGQTVRALGRSQLAVARRTSEAKRQIPHFYLSTDVDMTDADVVRRHLGGIKVSLTDLVVRASALALGQVPEVNASWSEEGLILNHHVNIGVAVALDDGNLVVPVVRDADALTLGEISTRLADLVDRARSGKIAPTDLEAGTFTISNLGMYGVREFHAIINPPESSILSVGCVRKTPVVGRNDELVVRAIMTISLSADHRVYSGATAAKFLACVRQLLEQPLALLSTPRTMPADAPYSD